MEQWEELDVDDSDLPSLLRPCKKRQQQEETSSSFSHPSPVLTSPQTSTENPQFLSQTLFNHPKLQVQPSRRIIPGPAGAVQAAMFRKVTDGNCEDESVSTQDYIRRAVENPEDDDDFKCNPWLCALEYIGLVDGSLPVTPLSSVMKCSSVGRFDQVVAIVQSCTPNGLGDLMVSLKDPTGIIGASVHRKAVLESVNGKDISIGSVLILRKVAIFLPSRYKQYLNITLNNLVKVIPRDCGPPRKHSYTTSTVKYADLNCSKASSSRIDIDIIDNGSKASSSRIDIDIIDNGSKASSSRIDIDIIDNGSKENSSSQYIHVNSQATNTVQNNDKEIEPKTELGKQRESLNSRSLTEWTDEQLNELFAIDDEGENFGF
ncbi:homologous recombination OB-fold protein [Impatiens glandulifera]|uniref:homologous recombination OB-fold protein n=1 Tax=Impatiens glandulifera TaxID=253017 RepID=UPI001FB0B687|nr:homologous recombination OB-fold protein [Impatiens glandulifera]